MLVSDGGYSTPPILAVCETIWDVDTLSQHLWVGQCGAGPPILAVPRALGSPWSLAHKHAESLVLTAK